MLIYTLAILVRDGTRFHLNFKGSCHLRRALVWYGLRKMHLFFLLLAKNPIRNTRKIKAEFNCSGKSRRLSLEAQESALGQHALQKIVRSAFILLFAPIFKLCRWESPNFAVIYEHFLSCLKVAKRSMVISTKSGGEY